MGHVHVHGLAARGHQAPQHELQEGVDRHQRPLHHRRQQQQRHGDAKDGVEDAEDLPLRGERRLVPVADGRHHRGGEEEGLPEGPGGDAGAVLEDLHPAVVGVHDGLHERLKVVVFVCDEKLYRTSSLLLRPFHLSVKLSMGPFTGQEAARENFSAVYLVRGKVKPKVNKSFFPFHSATARKVWLLRLLSSIFGPLFRTVLQGVSYL